MNWEKRIISAEKINENIIKLASLIPSNRYKHIYAIPRGGLIVGVYLSHHLGIPLLNEIIFNSLKHVDDVNREILVVDDLADTGKTLSYYADKYDTATIYFKPRSTVRPTYYVEECPNNIWIVFPWEKLDETPNRTAG